MSGDAVRVEALVAAMAAVRKLFPTLSTPTTALFTSASGRMAVIEKWLKDGGIVDKEDFRTAASAIKQAVIDKLTPAHFEDEHATLITAVQDRVAKLTA